MPPRIYHSLSLLTSYRETSLKKLTDRYTVRCVTQGRYFLEAKKLHAEVYLRYGFIKPINVVDGMIDEKTDPYAKHAEYFVAIDKERDQVVALIRQIHQRHGATLPLLRHQLTSRTYQHVHKNDIVELSAFAKKPGVDSRVTLLLFREMLIRSSERGHQYWVFACDKNVYTRLKTLFGGLLKRTGPDVFYMGSDVVPAEIELDHLVAGLRQSYQRSLPPLRGVRRFLYSSFMPVVNQSKFSIQRKSREFFWDQYAKTYDGLLKFAPYRHLVDHVSDMALAHEPHYVLDLGCGTGNVAVALLHKNETVMVDAVDWSRIMVKKLSEKVNSPQLIIRRRNAIRFLASTRRRYDVIVLNNVVYTIDDLGAFWRLISSRLKDDGRVIIANPDTGDSRVLLRDHIENQSAFSLLRPKLVLVSLFDAVISVLGRSNKYDFTPQDVLVGSLNRHGLVVDGEVGRCYGGHQRGIDLLFTIKKARNKV